MRVESRRRRTEIREEGKGEGGGESSCASKTRPLYRSCVCACVCVRVKNFVNVKREERKEFVTFALSLQNL